MADYWHKGLGPDVILSERLLLAKLAEEINKRFTNPIIINIGVNRGTSLHPLSAFGGRIIGIDIDLSHWRFQEDKLSHVEYIQADSSTYEFNEPVHLVFVDGDHEYPGVKGDIHNWQDRIVRNGIICFHDYNPSKFKHRLAGVKKAVDEWYQGSNKNWDVFNQAGSIIAFERIK